MNHKRLTTGLALMSGALCVLVVLLSIANTTSTALAMSLAALPNPEAKASNVSASIPTTITLVSSPNPAVVSQTVTFTATVHTPLGSSTPTGTVQFKADGVNLGVAVNLSGHKASVSTSWSVSGTHTITATYSGDANFGSNTSASIEQCIECGGTVGTNETNSFVLSNEPPGYLIHRLIAAGYGGYNLYDALVAIRNDAGGTGAVITDAFLAALRNAPATSLIFTTTLNQYDFDGAVAISDDGTAQIVDVYGQNYDGKPGTVTLRTEISGVADKGNFVYTTDPQIPLTSWNIVRSYGGGVFRVTTTYNAFAVAWAGPDTLYLPLVVK